MFIGMVLMAAFPGQPLTSAGHLAGVFFGCFALLTAYDKGQTASSISWARRFLILLTEGTTAEIEVVHRHEHVVVDKLSGEEMKVEIKA